MGRLSVCLSHRISSSSIHRRAGLFRRTCIALSNRCRGQSQCHQNDDSARTAAATTRPFSPLRLHTRRLDPLPCPRRLWTMSGGVPASPAGAESKTLAVRPQLLQQQ